MSSFEGLKEIRVAAAVIMRKNPDGKNEILATQRGYGDFKDWWEFPGGKIEEGESAEQALVREIREELNAQIEVKELLSNVVTAYPKNVINMDCFLCALEDGAFELLEHESARWLTEDELKTVRWLPADEEILSRVRRKMNDKLSSAEDSFILMNGKNIPCIGLGTWQSADGVEAYNAVLSALSAGYRHIDTAQGYGNEKSVGKALKEFVHGSSSLRQELFVTTKLWNNIRGYEETKNAVYKSLEDLGLDYIDLFLIHWPNPVKFRSSWQKANAETWKAMEDLYAEGKLRAIGVSNFFERHLEELLKTARVVPFVNQIKVCPGQPQAELISYCRKKGILIEGYSPLGTGGVFKSEEMRRLSEKYKRSIAQICIRWALQRGVVPLPKSVSAGRIKENIDVFDFELSKEDIDLISNLKNLEIKEARNPDETDF